jgi:NAD(P)-dependent dehydrogenase (short-subunit alcohol dehydrogenase family)
MTARGDGITGTRILITGAARGIGAALAERLAGRGARVAVAGLEPEALNETAARCGGPAFPCDVRNRHEVDQAVEAAVGALGGLDVVVANAGVAAQVPMVGGDPALFEQTVAVNVLGTYYTLRAAGAHIRHDGGYALAISSLASAINLPLMGAYNASKAAVEVMANTLRAELRPSGARVGIAYFAQLDTDMTTRGFSTEAAIKFASKYPMIRHAPLEAGISALERGIDRRSRIIAAPRWVRPLLPTRMVAQLVVERVVQRGLAEILQTAEGESVELTTPQSPIRPEEEGAP